MKTIEISEIITLLENYGEAEQHFIITRDGHPVAALFPIEDIDVESLKLSTNPKFIDIIEKSRKNQKQEGRIFLEDIDLSTET